ncbi:hypothetical protein GCM10027562_25290 [Arthrobacter pigmenti]
MDGGRARFVRNMPHPYSYKPTVTADQSIAAGISPDLGRTDPVLCLGAALLGAPADAGVDEAVDLAVEH